MSAESYQLYEGIARRQALATKARRFTGNALTVALRSRYEEKMEFASSSGKTRIADAVAATVAPFDIGRGYIAVSFA
jgi:hypothetical protein